MKIHYHIKVSIKVAGFYNVIDICQEYCRKTACYIKKKDLLSAILVH